MTTDVRVFPGHARKLGMAVALAGACAAFPVQAGSGSETGGMNSEDIVTRALSAAPPMVQESATVIGKDGKVLKEGDGRYTCMLTGSGAPVCADEPWMGWIDAWLNKTEYEGAPHIAVAYMLEGDAPGAGASNIDPYATEPTTDNQWIIEGPHLMILVPDPAMLDAWPDTPDADGPYVMWKDTSLAHLMVPLGPRPEQRRASE